MRSVSSAFYERLQMDNVEICELIDLELPGGYMVNWTTSNHPIWYTLSGDLTEYQPFPGSVPRGIEESSDLGVSVIDFVMANTGQLQTLIQNDFQNAGLKIGRVFTDTPDLGRMEIYHGQIGDFGHNRQVISGQARNGWKSRSVQWPPYNYQDTCVWKFGSAGCGFNTNSITLAVNSIRVNSSTAISILCKSGALAAYDDGRFDFGRMTVTAGVNSGHVRTIRSQTGDRIELSHALPSSDLTGMTVSIFPGCRKRALQDCQSLYNNSENFLGFPYIPIQESAF